MTISGSVLETGSVTQLLERSLEKELTTCIQCGVCSGSCPFGQAMAYPPQRAIAAIKAGQMERVLVSNTPWYCSACYLCTARCSMNIPVTDIMYMLKRMALREGHTEGDRKTSNLSTTMVDIIRKNGRNHELSLLVRHNLRTNPIGQVKMAPLGLKLVRKGRLPFKAEKVEKRQEFQAVMDKTKSLGGSR